MPRIGNIQRIVLNIPITGITLIYTHGLVEFLEEEWNELVEDDVAGVDTGEARELLEEQRLQAPVVG